MTKRRGGMGSPLGSGGMGGGNQAGMLKQLQKMQEDMQKAQEALGEEVLEVEVGGVVKIEITGHQRIKTITIKPDALDTSDPEWATDLQDMLVVAVNQAIEKAQTRAAERMEAITGNLGGMLPGGLGGLLG
jgi:DNA-binding YbaB/EbfC family protein